MVIAMSKPYVLVTNGVVQCEHGGTVVLKSAISGHVIGGKVPVDMESLPGSKIEGCPHRSSVNAQCKVVSSISSASTESNVGWSGKHYVVRTIGKTDKGAGLVLVDPGQGNHALNAPGGGSNDPVTLEVVAIDPKKAAEHLPGETCRFHPMRVSGDNLRPLRAYRNFDVFTDYHWAHTDVHTSDRVVTYTDAYLYVTHAGKTDEWRILSMGDPYRPTMGQVFYQRTEDGAVFTGVPFFKPEGDVEFLYANVKLSAADRGKFTPVKVTVTPSKTIYLNDYGEISKMVSVEAKVLKKKHLITADEAREGTEKTVATVITLEDPVGEIEDLYDDYEFSYAKHYFLNKGLFTDIKNRNRYAYAVADILDYLYVSEEEQQSFNDQHKSLSECYESMRSIVCGEFGDAIFTNMETGDLAPAIDMDIAKDYVAETIFIDAGVFKPYTSFSINIGGKPHRYGQSRVRGQSRVKKLRYTGTESKKAPDVLAYVVFSVAYSGRYRQQRDAHAKLSRLAKEFYYLLKTAKPVPQFDEHAIEETRTVLKTQTELLDLFENTPPLLEEFENLDATLKQVAFDPKAAQKLKASNNYGFSGLHAGRNEQRGIAHEPNITTCAVLAKGLAKQLQNPKLTTLLDTYATVTSADGAVDYCYFGINLLLALNGPRIRIDEESDAISPFSAGLEAHAKWLKHLTTTMNALSQEQAVDLHVLPAKQYYLNALYAYVFHAKMPRDGKPKGSEQRRQNADGFLKNFAVSIPVPEEDLTNPLDYANVDEGLRVKTQVEELYANLQAINGISSNLPELDKKVKEQGAVSENKPTKKPGLGGARSEGTIQAKFLDDVAIKSYQASLASIKGLAFIMTVANLDSYIRGTEKLKLHNMVQAGNDIISITSTLTEKGAQLKGGSLKSASDTVQHLLKIDEASLKLVVKLGAVAVLLNGLNELTELDESDVDGKIAVRVKNLLVVALMLSPGWAAVGAIVVVELAWLFLKERVVDSPLELYLQRNLFYNNRADSDLGKSLNTFWTLVNHEPAPQRFLAPILVEAVQNSRDGTPYTHMGIEREGKDVKGFDIFDGIRRFVADNYDAHPHTMERALSNELAALKQVLYGMKAEIADAKVLKFDLPMDKVYYQTHLAIDASVLDDTRHLLSVFEGHYSEIDPKTLKLSEDKKLVDMAQGVAFKHLDGLRAFEGKECGLIIVNDDIVLKYTAQYHNRSDSSYWAGSTQTLFTLTDLKSGGLSAEDYDQVNKLLEKEGN